MLLGPLILKILILILACTLAYQSYLAFRFAYTSQSVASALTKGNSPLPGRVVWGLASLAISLCLFFYLIDWLRSLAKF